MKIKSTLAIIGMVLLGFGSDAAQARGYHSGRGFRGRGRGGAFHQTYSGHFYGPVFTHWPTAEERLAHSPEAISAAQGTMRSLGYYHGSINGSLTPETRRSLHAFQGSDDIANTGVLDFTTMNSLGLDARKFVGDEPSVSVIGGRNARH